MIKRRKQQTFKNSWFLPYSMKKKLPLVSVIVLNWNGLDYVKGCLPTVIMQDYPNKEIIFVDNGSTDGSSEYVRKNFPKIKIIQNDKNYGFSEGNNIGVRQAKARYVMLLSNDTKVSKNWLLNSMRAMLKNRNVAIIGAKIRNLGDGFYGETTSLGNYATILGDPIDTDDLEKTFCASGVSFLFDKEKIKEPFDADYFAYGEDLYAAWVARLKGYEIKVAQDSVIEHYGGTVRKKLPELMEFHGEKNRITNLLLFYEAKTLLKVAPLLAANIIFNILISIPKMRLHVRLKSYLWIIKNWGRIMKKRKVFQGTRKIRDEELFKYFTARIPYKLRGFEKIINFMMGAYCFIFIIPVKQ